MLYKVSDACLLQGDDYDEMLGGKDFEDTLIPELDSDDIIGEVEDGALPSASCC